MNYDTLIAANTSKGFFSYFDELLSHSDLSSVYLIKGGPGCGKSTFMKNIANHCKVKSLNTELIHCSSDQSSLDAIRICDNGIVVMDATSPHAFDLKYPGVRDKIIDLTQFWNEKELIKHKSSIVSISNSISEKYKCVYSILKSAGILYSSLVEKATQNNDSFEITQLVKKLIKQNGIMPTQCDTTVYNRFLNGISSTGTSGFVETIDKLCDEIILIEDGYSLAGVFLSKFLNYFKKTGYEILVFHNPLCPDIKIEHIIVPQLRFGIITSSSLFEPVINENKIIKKIFTRNFIDKDYVNQNKNKILFRKKMIKQLIDRSVIELDVIKGLHDELEQYYINAMDFDKLNEFTNIFINTI